MYHPTEDIERDIERGEHLYEYLTVCSHFPDNQEANSYGRAAIPRYPVSCQRLGGEEIIANAIAGTSALKNTAQPSMPHSYFSPDVRRFPESPLRRIN